MPKPEIVTITKIHEDNKHVDCTDKNGDAHEYILTIANNLTVGNTGLMFSASDDTLIIITR